MATRTELEAAITRRMGQSSTSSKTLAAAYLRGVQEHALSRTVGGSPIPTSLTTDRAELVIAICREYKQLLTGREIEVLLRVTPSSAKSILRLVEAVYDDEVSKYLMAAAFRGATSDGSGKFGSVDGNRVVLRDAAAVESLLEQCERSGIKAIHRPDDAKKPHLVHIDDALDLKPYKLQNWKQ